MGYKKSAFKMKGPSLFKKSPCRKGNPCWDKYEMIGTKMKDGKKVPNCVPRK